MGNRALNKPAEETTVLVTGGAGFIGSHTVVELLGRGYDVVVVDDLSNSSQEALERVRALTGTEGDGQRGRLTFYKESILDAQALEQVFERHEVDVIIHFAGFKAVGESVRKPLEYYWNNVAGTLVLCDVARRHDCKNLVFSSSATVYGEPEFMPITEDCPKATPTNPYGQTKSMLEQVLSDLYVGDDEWNVVLLRYFNPIGAHESGMRDYIHVVDLARGHVAALDWMAGRVGTGEPRGLGSMAGRPAEDGTRRGVGIFNLGTGKGSSVLDVIHAFERACGHELPYEVLPRRAGDVAENYAACDKARDELGWVAEYDLDRMCEDSWRWQSGNPNGYRG